MEVILLERIDRLGQMGDVVKVKDGYARNFLLPKRKALRASKENLDFFEKEKVNLEASNLMLCYIQRVKQQDEQCFLKPLVLSILRVRVKLQP